MDYSSSSPAVATMQGIIMGTFDVSAEEAHIHACRLAVMAARWMGVEESVDLPWAYIVKKDLGGKLRWKSEAEHEKFLAEQEQWYKDYDALYKSPHRA